jgi:ubiquinone/menaquinone biosynthesis C-methylase UbiE
MSQKTHGIHKFFSFPLVYSLTQKIMSGEKKRETIVKKIVKKNSTVLDIGCGTGKIIEALPNVNYYGYDISEVYINYAKKKYNKPNIKFFRKKFTSADLKKLPKFDYVLLFGILHHLGDIEVKKLLFLIKKILKKGGLILTCDPVYVKNQNFLAKFLIDNDVGENIRFANGYIDIIKKIFRKTTYRVVQQNILPYNWFISKIFKS